MTRVAASEYDLLTVARALVGQGSPETVEPLLRRAREIPAGMGPTAMTLLERTLSRGVVLELARRGGWRNHRTLVDGKPRAGRAWERHEAPKLVFSRASMELLRWLVSQPLGGAGSRQLRRADTYTKGDELLLYLAADLLLQTGLETTLGNQVAFHASPLCWLGYTDHLSRQNAEPNIETAKYLPWVTGDGAVLLECLSGDLTRHQVRIERTKEHIGSCERMSRLGHAQERVLLAFLDAADQSGRRDLALFIIETVRLALAHRPGPDWWVANLESRVPLRERTDAIRAAGALLRIIGHLHQQAEEHRGRRFFDDDYDASQLLLTQWEQIGDDTHHYAAHLLRQLSSLDAALG